MKVSRNSRLQAEKSSIPKHWGPKPHWHSAELRETRGGHLVVDLPFAFWLVMRLKLGARVWFHRFGNGVVVTRTPGGQRNGKRSSSRIAKVHQPLKSLLEYQKETRRLRRRSWPVAVPRR
jgi:hypothetical protein